MRFYSKVLYSIFALITGASSLFAQMNDSNDILIEIMPDEIGGSAISGEKNSNLLQNESSTDSSAALEKEPVLKNFVKAVYPEHLLKEAITGSVTLDLLVNDSGHVDSVYIVKGIHPELDSAVVTAARKFVFTPAVAGGIPVPVILTYQYDVTLDEVIDKIEEYVNFQGFVYERGTRTPVRDAEVYVSFDDTLSDSAIRLPFSLYMNKIGTFSGQLFEQGALVTHTDSSGKFMFRSLPASPVRVIIPAVGYEQFETTDTIRRGEVLDVIYRMQRTSYAEYEITVYGKNEEKEVSRHTLTLNEVKKIPGFGGDAVKVVQALPGVARPTFGGGAVIVRGAPSWDSKFFLDGVKIPQLYHFGGIKSTYNSDGLESVNLYPGGFGVRYGSTIAGVIELKGRNAKRDRYSGFADVNLFDATVFAEGPIGKNAGIIVSARRSYIGDILGAITKSKYFNLPVSIVPFYYDYLARVDVDLTKNNKVFFTLFGSNDQMELIAPFVRGGSSDIDKLTDRLRQKVAFTMFMSGWEAELTGSLKNSLRVAFIPESGYSSAFGFVKIDFKAYELSLRDELQYKISSKLQIDAGVDLWYQKYYQEGAFPNTINDNTIVWDTTDLKLGLASPYLQLEIKPVEQLLILTGLRYDYYNELNYKGGVIPEFWPYEKFDNSRAYSGEPSLRLALRYKFAKNQTAKCAVGTYNQTPQPVGFVTHKVFGNPAHPATKARHITAGYEAQLTDLISVDVQVYHNAQWDIPDTYTSSELTENNDLPSFIPEGKGRMYGLELLLRHDQGDRLFGWIAYSLSRSERFDRGENRWKLYGQDQTHNLQLILNYRLKRQFEAGTRIRYVSGNPYTPVIGRIYNADKFSYKAVYGKANSKRNKPFVQVDLRVDKKFVFDTWMLAAYLDFQNVFSFIYASPEFTIYDFDYSDQTTVSAPFIPSFGIRAEF
ncbi:MAG TPA: TonB-dependent receptor [Chitinispirillaceae bacterium]|nr:TonB-dependent receptor [Chitinispirillaceae bacterium]